MLKQPKCTDTNTPDDDVISWSWLHKILCLQFKFEVAKDVVTHVIEEQSCSDDVDVF